MKKIYTFLFSFLLLAMPFLVFALGEVDISLTDESLADTKNISIRVDSGTDTLGKIVLPVQFSSDVLITDVSTGSIVCSSFDFEEATSSILISCELDSPTTLNGVLGTISFTSTQENYSFSVLDNADLDIEGLSLGNVTNVGNSDTNIMPVDTNMEEGVNAPLEGEDFFVTGQEGVDPGQTEETKGISDFLPYILIGGSVVLLISIVGILLSKKGGSKRKNKGISNDIPSTSVQQPEKEESLRSMVNKTEPAIGHGALGGDPSLTETADMNDTTPIAIQQEQPIPTDFSPAAAHEETDLEEILNSQANEDFEQDIQDMTGTTPVNNAQTPEQTMPESPIQQTSQMSDIPYTNENPVNAQTTEHIMPEITTEIPTQSVNFNSAPMTETPVQPMDFNSAPVTETPVQPMDFNSVPVTETPVQPMDFNSVPVTETPVQPMDFNSVPVTETPVQPMDFNNVPTTNMPYSQTPEQSIPQTNGISQDNSVPPFSGGVNLGNGSEEIPTSPPTL